MGQQVASLYAEISVDPTAAEKALKDVSAQISNTGKDFAKLADMSTRAGADFRNIGGDIDNWIGQLKAATPENARFASESAKIWTSFQEGKISSGEARGGLEKLRGEMVQAEKAAKGFGGKFGTLKEAAAGLKGGLDAAVQGLTGFSLNAVSGAAAVGMLATGAKQAIADASDLAETTSKVGVVFGSSSKEVLAFGDNAATSLGMSKNEALSAAGTFGNLFVSMGMATDKSADMSTGIVQLAGDLASFNNMEGTEVLDKLRAGLTGETEPLKSLGVNLNAAMVQAKAMSMGLADAEGQLSASAKAQATYALILEQTKTAQGDFARTSDGLANQQRILNAELKNASAELGTNLLPAWLAVIQTLNGAIGTFKQIQELNKGMPAAINEHDAAVAKSSETYKAYLAEKQREIELTGAIVQSRDGEIQILKHAGSQIVEVTGQYQIMSEGEYNAARATDDWNNSTREAIQAQQESAAAINANATQTDTLTAKQQAAADSEARMAAMRTESNAGMKAYSDRMAAMGEAYAKQQEGAEKAKEAQEKLNDAMKSWQDQVGSKMGGMLDKLKGNADAYYKALAAVDRMMGTNLETSARQEEAMQALVDAYSKNPEEIAKFEQGLNDLEAKFSPVGQKTSEVKDKTDALAKALGTTDGKASDAEGGLGGVNTALGNVNTTMDSTNTKIGDLNTKLVNLKEYLDNLEDVTVSISVEYSSNAPDTGGGDNCFIAGTKVLTPWGERNIEDVQAGDTVSMLSTKGMVIPVTVKHLIRRGAREDCVSVALSNGRTITGAPNHPMWVVGEGWTWLAHLEPGERIASVESEPVAVLDVRDYPGRHEMYNFEIDHAEHTFVVENCVAHNADQKPLTVAGLTGLTTSTQATSGGMSLSSMYGAQGPSLNISAPATSSAVATGGAAGGPASYITVNGLSLPNVQRADDFIRELGELAARAEMYGASYAGA